ncbi:MAG: helix-turn-helix domain-containing protein [Bacteroidales bacterium]
MLLFLSLLGIFLSGILLYYNARKYPSSIYLGAFFLLISLYGFIQYSLFYSKSVGLVSLVFVNIGFLSYLTGPALYLYVRSILTDQSRLKARDTWHLLPALIFLVAAFPHIFSPWSHKVLIATRLVENPGYIAEYKATFLQQFLPNEVIFLSRPVLILAYTGWAAGIFIRFIIQRGKSQVFSHQHYMTRWLSCLLGLLFVLIVSHMLVMLESISNKDLKYFFTFDLLQVLSGLGLSGLLTLPFFFPGILYGLPRFPETIVSLKPVVIASDSLPGEVKRNQLNLEPDYLVTIGQKADSCMKELQPYLQPECNLAYLSKLVKIPVHHLAYYFREEKKQSFNDYRNEWRIKHAKYLIKDGKANELTLEAIGLLSGFSSRNTFFTAFKKAEGISPGAFATQFTG